MTKKLKTRKNNNILTILAPFITLVIIFLTIGYSAFQNLGIISDITASVKPDMNIKITDLQINNTSDAVVVSKDYNSINNNNNTYTGKILGDLTFTKTTSSVTFKVEVTNFGNVEMGVSSISGLPSNLTYELDTTTYDVGEKLCDRTTTTKCTLGSKTDIYITIKYKSGSGTNTSTNLSLNLDFTFKEVHNIYYGGNVIDYVLDGGNKTASLGSNAPDYIQVTGSSTSHSYTKPNVTINGVTSDITIEEIHKIYLDNTELDTVVHGGNKTVSLGSNAPASESNITITGTYVSKSYTNPNLTLNGVTSDIYITISSGSGGNNGGTWEQPVEDNTTIVYDPVNDPPPEGTTLYTEVAGEPEVTVENGKVTRFEYTDIDSNTGISTPSGGLNTGVLAFDGEDFTVTLTAEYAVSNISGGSTYPVLDLSSSNPADQTVDGFLVLVALNYGGTNYNESNQNIGSTNSSKKYMKWRFNKYIDGGTGTSTGSQDYYSNAAGTAYYTYRFATLSTTIETTIKIYCRNNVYTSDLLYNNVLKARPRYASANNERKYTFDNPVADTTIKLGYWKNKSGQEYTTNFTIKEFSVVKE